MLSADDILRALRDCYDPTLPCNIVDLGLVRHLAVSPDRDAPGAGVPGVPQKILVEVAVTATSPTEDAEAHLSAQISNRLAGLEGVSRTSVRFEPTPAWSPSDITPTGRRTLGLDGNPGLIQIR